MVAAGLPMKLDPGTKGLKEGSKSVWLERSVNLDSRATGDSPLRLWGKALLIVSRGQRPRHVYSVIANGVDPARHFDGG